MKEGKTKSLKLNFVYLMIYKVFVVIVPLIIAPYVSRILGVTLIGEYSYWMSLIGYFTLCADFGLEDYGSRLIAKQRDNKEEYSKTFYEIMICRILLGFGLLILFFSLNFAGVFGKSNIVIFSILSLHIIATSISPFFLFTGLERFKEITIRTFVLKLLLVVLIFLCVKSKDDFINYIIIYACVVLSGPILMIPYLFKMVNKPSFKNLHLLVHFKKTIVFFIPILSINFYTLIDKSMIMRITQNKAENGYFEQAYKLINVINNALNALNLLMLSRISYLYEIKDYEEIQNKTRKSFRLLFLIALPCVFGLELVSKYFVPMFFGAEFIKSTYIIYILAPTILLISLRNLIQSIYFIPRNKISISNSFIITGVVVNVLLNLVLIKYYGSIGAAISYLISEIVIASLMIIYCRKDIPLKLFWETSKFPLAACFFMVEVGLFIIMFVLNKFHGGTSNKINFLLIFVGCAFTYCFTILFMKEPLAIDVLSGLKRKIKKH